MKILVCGGRTYVNKKKIWDTLDLLCDPYMLWDENRMLPKNLVIIHGGAKGADTLAGYWAVNNGVPVEEYKAEWDKYGKKAGYLRNQKMLDEGKPDLVVAFPGGPGTAMMVKIARKAGVPVHEVPQQI